MSTAFDDSGEALDEGRLRDSLLHNLHSHVTTGTVAHAQTPQLIEIRFEPAPLDGGANLTVFIEHDGPIIERPLSNSLCELPATVGRRNQFDEALKMLFG